MSHGLCHHINFRISLLLTGWTGMQNCFYFTKTFRQTTTKLTSSVWTWDLT